jgi:membrane fusion protein, copper/silver efflux system
MDKSNLMKTIFNDRFVQLGLVLVFGLLIGWLIFGGSPAETHQREGETTEATIWTCSMHPQIRQDEPGKCPLCGMDLIPLARGNGQQSESPFVYSMSPEAAALANVQTARVTSAAPEYEVYLTGRVAPNERRLGVITADYSGRIERLFVDFTGQTVNRGERMATIYSPELITAQKELIEAAKNKNSNPAIYNAVKEKLRLWKITEKQIDAIENRGEVLTELDIYAASSGIVLNRNVSTGDYVSRGSVLFEIADLSSVWIILDAYETDLAWIRTGSKVNFRVASIPGREFTSTVTFIDPLINPQTRTASVRAEANNPGAELKPDMFVTATVKAQLSVKGKSLLIPSTAVLWTGTRSVVYVKVPGTEFPAYEMREINIGPRAGGFYVINEGLVEGEEIVTNGVFAVDAAAQLSGNYSMMNRPVSKRIQVPEQFRTQLTEAAKSYFDLKNALIDSDFNRSRNGAGRFLSSLRMVNMEQLDRHAHDVWMELETEMKNAAGLISKAADLDEQRKHFENLSNGIIEAADIFGLKINMVYVQYCPMAFEDEGAYWLSESDEILNPYFGDEMLHCGEIIKKISSVDSYREADEQPRQPLEHQH